VTRPHKDTTSQVRVIGILASEAFPPLENIKPTYFRSVSLLAPRHPSDYLRDGGSQPPPIAHPDMLIAVDPIPTFTGCQEIIWSDSIFKEEIAREGISTVWAGGSSGVELHLKLLLSLLILGQG
jgi:hypothetical protein